MPDLHSLSTWAIAIGAAFCVGMSKTGFGGLGIVSVALFALLFPAKQSTGALLPLMIFADLLAVRFYRRHANWNDLIRLLPATLAGIVIGWWLMPRIPDGAFTRLLGWLILGLMALTIVQRRCPGMMRRATEHPLLGLFAGLATGVTTMLANAAGAVTAFYFLARRMDKMTFVGTAAWFFMIVNISKAPFSAQLGLITLPSLLFDLALLPVVLVGGIAGRMLLHRVPQRLFEWITICFAIGAAIRLIASAG
ncbi:MAG: sulfite exporter TauE/SafE family protein [Chthoniobacterales bacterium]|nr:sulfite exporter TauE/SafE family protein [Chthoniobacterales bacterium]